MPSSLAMTTCFLIFLQGGVGKGEENGVEKGWKRSAVDFGQFRDFGQEGKKKARNFGHPTAPTLRPPPPSWAHPSGPLFRGLCLFGAPSFMVQKFNIQKLAEVEIGRSRPRSGGKGRGGGEGVCWTFPSFRPFWINSKVDFNF